MEKELPIGWVEIELGNILKLKNGYAFKSDDFKDTGIPVIRISNIQNELVQTENAARVDQSKIKQEFVVQQGDILIAMSGATTGKYGIYNEEVVALQNQRVGNLIPHDESLTSRKFILYLLGGLKKEIEEKAYGGAQPNISPKLIEEIRIGLPPLPEQQRIVAKLDTLFGHLDALKTRLDRIPQLLKDFRQKVLTQAVTGKLTEEWREGRELEEWEESPLKEFSTSRLGKMLDKEKNQGIPTKYLRNINVRWFDFDLDDLFEIKVSEEEMQKYSIQDRDVLVCEGGEPGRAAIWRNGNTNIIFQKALHRVRLNNNILPEFFLYNLKVDSVNNVLSSLFTGTTIKHLTGVAFSDYSINIPPLEEQQEIVRRVESLFAKADQIEASYQKLKAKIEQLPQALLAKAFRGELVEQLPTDGDARDLLEQIKLAKEGLEKGGKSILRKTK